MPQITVEYSASLQDAFDRRAFALALHTAAAPIIDSELESFKSRSYRVDDEVIGDGSPAQAMLHVEVAILSGRDQDTKRHLAATALSVAADHLTPPPGLTVQTTVEIRDLDSATYHKRVDTGRA
ncbi:5-carboxymethyl-2-hydroxymuconate Delta-isomerase [Nonomuraea africana]|uniref:5-carboxymethyl-2-hydroxymuconate isomerase n=1 Tax=Nonomuraea africana TaxID=46171 RepID=A0ABR9KD15_9ACTN|nr:isomerase [Nonomuraea africana]MBE1559899.1 5-carboxymethyl-2-hydroxymuconate isomerase [Nonomuraea africana]